MKSECTIPATPAQGGGCGGRIRCPDFAPPQQSDCSHRSTLRATKSSRLAGNYICLTATVHSENIQTP